MVKKDRKQQPQPTGRWCAVRRDCLNVENLSHIACVDSDTMNFLLSNQQSVSNENEE